MTNPPGIHILGQKPALVPVLGIRVDPSNPHALAMSANAEGLAFANKYTLAGLLQSLALEVLTADDPPPGG